MAEGFSQQSPRQGFPARAFAWRRRGRSG